LLSGEDHVQVAQALAYQGVVLYSMGKMGVASRVLDTALERIRTGLHPQHPCVTAIARLCGEAHCAQKHTQEALSYYQLYMDAQVFRDIFRVVFRVIPRFREHQ
jgi:hypothetical protein